jgi:hypothetical protein
VEKLGADICINYKTSDFKERLTKETAGFVEIYYGRSFNLEQYLPGSSELTMIKTMLVERFLTLC